MSQRGFEQFCCLSSGFGILVLLGQLSLMASARTCPPKCDAKSCFAFLREGDIHISCGGRIEQVTAFGDVEEFALTFHETTLVLVRRLHEEQGRVRANLPAGRTETRTSHDALEVIPFTEEGTRRRIPLGSSTSLASSCGTVLAITWDPETNVGQGMVRDALSNERLDFGPYKNFRCSVDGKVVVGWRDPGHWTLELGLPPDRKLPDHARMLIPPHYDVSPSGDFTAYGRDMTLCLARETGESECISGWGSSVCHVSVRDGGDVLAEIGTEESECDAVAFWRAGMKQPKIILRWASKPQWITTDLAAKLTGWRDNIKRK